MIAGDLLPKDGGIGGQKRFFGDLEGFLQRMVESADATVLLYFGNDDFHFLEGELDLLAAKDLCVHLNGRVYREDGFVFVGMNLVRDYPFRYKHYCARDEDLIACPVQFGPGFTFDDAGGRIEIADLPAFLADKPSIPEELNRLLAELRPEEMERSIWLVHQPPAGLGMDICTDGNEVGSPSVLRFIREKQPLFGCSGHIHESPYMRGGKWIGLVRDALWFQPGQMAERLHYVSLEVTPEFNLRNIRHSIFGATAIESDRF